MVVVSVDVVPVVVAQSGGGVVVVMGAAVVVTTTGAIQIVTKHSIIDCEVIKSPANSPHVLQPLPT